MKCRRCENTAVIKLPRHNSAFCDPCFQGYLHKQVIKAISENTMFQKNEAILVAVSGGKDSLVLWEILIRLGYQTVGLHLNLGIGEYSQRSQQQAESFAASRGLKLIVQDYKEDYGLGVVEIAKKTARPPCSACGTMKRHHFNRIAMDRGFPVVATGHNLDDEAARLLGNLLSWQTDYLQKQTPVLSDKGGLWARKVKPLYRLPEREIAAYAVLNRIDYIIEECPMSKGAKMFTYKETLNRIEERSPGSKLQFYLGFQKQRPLSFPSRIEETKLTCRVCGQPSLGERCSYCRLMDRVAAS
ncbi:TIGR00269 family protein [Nitrospira defluvii]|nr:TIGR00269 family protein [Nitrospira defluvii]